MSEKSPLINTTTQIYEFDELQQTRPPIIVICKFCNEDCDEQEYNAHKQKCLYNLINSRSKQILQNTMNSNQSSSLFNGDDITYTPCQFCMDLIESYNYLNHQIACKQRQQQKRQIQEQAQRKTRKSIVMHLCKYCGEAYSSKELDHHQINCTENLLTH